MVAKAKFQITAEDKTKKAFGDVNSNLKKLGTGFAVAGAAGLAGFVALEKKTLDYADSLQKLSQRSGATVEFLSEMSRAADLAGTSTETMAKGIKAMQKSASDAVDGLATAAGSYAQLGIEVDSFINLSPEQQMDTLAEALSRVENESKRTQLAMNTMGRAGSELLSLFQEGASGLQSYREEARRAGETISTELADKAAEANDAIRRLQGRFNALAIDMAGPVADGILEVVDLLGDLADGFSSLGDSFDEVDLIDLGFSFETFSNNVRVAAAVVGDSLLAMKAGIREFVAVSLAAFDPSVPLSNRLQHIKNTFDAENKLYIEQRENFREAIFGITDADLSPSNPVVIDIKDGVVIETSNKATKAKKEQRDAVADLIAQLEKEADTVDLTQSQIKLYEVATAGASLTQLALAQDLIETTDNIRAQMDAAEEAAQAVQRQADEMDRLAESVRHAVDPYLELQEAQKELNELLDTGRINTVEYSVSMSQLEKRAKDIGDAGKDAFKDLENAVEGWHRSFADAVIDAEFTFNGFAESILKQLAKIALAQATKPIFSGFSDFLGGLFQGRANGGPVQAGVPFIVGERRPELFVPDVPGRIEPNLNSLGGGGNISTTININNDGSTSRSGDSSQLAQRLEAAVKSVMVAEKRPGGLLA